jgi:hypothetical protein
VARLLGPAFALWGCPMRYSILIRTLTFVAIAIFWAAQTNATPIYASTVVDSTTSNLLGPTSVLGAPNGMVTNFFRDGNEPGFVVVSFDDLISDGAGDDLIVHLTDWLPGENEI